MFAFRNQPLKALYLLYFAVTGLLIRLPYWTIASAIPACRPKRTWSMRRSFEVRLLNAMINRLFCVIGFPPEVDPVKDSKAASTTGFVWVDEIPEEFIKGEVAAMAKKNSVLPARIYGYWFGKRASDGSHGQRASPGELVYYHIHGGGFIAGSCSPQSTSAKIPLGVLDQCAGKVDRAFGIDYRLASAAPFPPSNPFPAALMDALSGYYYLVKTLGFSPRNMILGGDSAGSHIAVVLVRYLETAKISSLSGPRALLLVSPAMDWGCTHDDNSPSSSMELNSKTDFWTLIVRRGYAARCICGSLDADEVLFNSWLAPASLKISNPAGLFHGFPRTCIMAGGAEQIVDSIRTFRDRIIKDIGESNVTYLEYPDATHDFLAQTWHEPERSEALMEIKGFLTDIFVEGRDRSN
ncbi:alpha/beta-hydrolase [Gautieria morchelliformis]|nr:alpha/beta-hydrolase [Gautieria morchelliformis]